MMNVSIDQRLKAAAPRLALGIVQARMSVTKHDSALWKLIDQRIERIMADMDLGTIGDVPEIKALRDAYRAIGKDPSRYRGSQEALFRRILQGKGLYRVNTVVDINNLVSLETKHSVGSYDLARLNPPVSFRIGDSGETYKGIGKDVINIAELPVFADSLGPFGSPTSDSERAMITAGTKEVLLIIISFSGPVGLPESIRRAADLLVEYAKSPRESVETVVVDDKP